MAGRTHLQHALPITFGYKAVVCPPGLLRHRQRIGQRKAHVLVAEFSGAAGTLASLGTDGLAVQAAFARELGLGALDHLARQSRRHRGGRILAESAVS